MKKAFIVAHHSGVLNLIVGVYESYEDASKAFEKEIASLDSTNPSFPKVYISEVDFYAAAQENNVNISGNCGYFRPIC